jgi:predicted lipid-binding transport protein (Tim44 family)
VALQLLSELARDNPSAQAGLRATAHAPGANQQDATGRRILDGGEDPIYGPFMVSELGSGGATRRLPTLGLADPSLPPVGAAMSPNRGLLVMVAVVGVILVLLVGFVIAARVLGPSDESPRASLAPTPAPPQSVQTSPRPAISPAAAPAAQPTSAPAAQTAPQASVPPTPQQASAPPSPSAAPPAQLPAGSPVDIIRQHYSFIDAKRYAEGYALMDAHLRSLNSSADYQSWFVDKISVKPISIDLASQTDTEARVRAVVDSTDRVNGQSVTKRVSEEFVLHAEDGAWRIDQVSSL